jgi:hypothetical protein
MSSLKGAAGHCRSSSGWYRSGPHRHRIGSVAGRNHGLFLITGLAAALSRSLRPADFLLGLSRCAAELISTNQGYEPIEPDHRWTDAKGGDWSSGVDMQGIRKHDPTLGLRI